MSEISNTDEPAVAKTDAAPRPAAVPWTRLFAWQVRRELWENRAVYLAPMAVAGIVLAGLMLGSGGLARTVLRAAAIPAPTHSALVAHGGAIAALALPYVAVTAAPALAGLVVAVFYCLAALNGERRDRSILFWKSLPVSDTTAVAGKAFVPLVVQPVATLAIVFAGQLAILLYSTVLLLLNGVDPGLLWVHTNLPMIWVMLPYGLALNALWYVPLYGWLLLVSAFAKRMTFLWAVGAPLALALFELVTFRTHHVWSLLNDRVMRGFAEAFSVGGLGKVPISSFSQVDPGRFFALPGLWIGFALGAAFFVATVWQRRRGDPV